MKTKLIILLLLLAVGIPAANNQQNPARQLSWSADNGNGTYTNPLFF
jgi:xylan 1,4-beta-xylosidase